ncbi:hypothetical protein MYF49_002683 [Enterococcus faecium]|nr:hypothetical protein [Enterococcus faecium]
MRSTRQGDPTIGGGKAALPAFLFNKGQLWQQLAEFVHIAQRQRKRAESKMIRSERLPLDTDYDSNLYPKLKESTSSTIVRLSLINQLKNQKYKKVDSMIDWYTKL